MSCVAPLTLPGFLPTSLLVTLIGTRQAAGVNLLLCRVSTASS